MEHKKKNSIIFCFICLIFVLLPNTQARICIPEVPCATCFGIPTSCTACVQGYYLLGDECVECPYPCIGCNNEYECFQCDDGYYLVTAAIDKCLPCLYPCLTCYEPSFCNSCGWEPEKRIDDRYCRCKSNFFEYDEKCLECTPPCVACSSKTKCFDCDSDNTGLYLDNFKCLPCVYPCLTCLGPTFCLRCGFDAAKRVSDSTCRCKDGWWDDIQECRACIPPCNKCTSDTFCLYCTNEMTGLYATSEGLCEKCWYPCKTCTGITDCLSCGWTPELRRPDKGCSCLRGYYECGTLCKPCIAPCTDCTSETNCLDCNNAITGSYYYNDHCKPCEYPCATCEDEDICISCGYGPENRNDEQNCICKEGYYEIGYECQLCILPCVKCDSLIICHDCNESSSGYYKNDQNECVRCIYPCQLCSSATHCLECLSHLTLRDMDDPSCPCSEGYFERERECVSCSPPCKTCDSYSIKCNSCIEGTYLDGDLCQYCKYPCINCKNLTVCLTCGWGVKLRIVPKNVQVSYDEWEWEGSCSCIEGYYENNKNCLPCVLPCVTCSSLTVCITMDCEESISGTYYYNGQCLQCNYPCKTCYSSFSCRECGYDVENRNQSNNCRCKAGYFENVSDQICLPCVRPCITCSSQTICISFDCQSDFSGLYLDGTQCVPCVYPCKLCTSRYRCLSCGWDAENRAGSFCRCKTGFYEENQHCYKCIEPCSECDSKTECTETQCRTHVNQDGNTIYTGKAKKLYLSSECQQCDYPCFSCKDYDLDHCLVKCGYGPDLRVGPGQEYDYYFKYHGSSTLQVAKVRSNECICKNGYYQRPETQECLPCNYPCSECTSQDNCIYSVHNRCQFQFSGLYLVLGSGFEICRKCNFPCLTCQVDNPDNCLTCGYGGENRVPPDPEELIFTCLCRDGFYDQGQECLPCITPCSKCTDAITCTEINDCDMHNSGLYPDIISLICKKCEAPCKTCSDSTECLSCGYGAELRNDPPQCGCKDGYYDESNQCFECILPCLTCESATVCITVYDCAKETSGFYPEDQQCKKCEYPCITCENATECLSCGWDTELRYEASHEKSCQCIDGYFSKNFQCFSCRAPCETCTDELTCLTLYDCENLTSGAYPSPSGRCLACEHPCKTCLSQTECHTCLGNQSNRKGPPTCECEDDYYEYLEECYKCPLPCATCSSASSCLTYYDCDFNISGKYSTESGCVQCQYPCYRCSSPENCLSCDTELGKRNNDPLCTCKTRYFDNITCKKCRLPCKECTNAVTCTQKYPCQIGEYWNEDTQKCYACEYPCLDCSDQRICRTCGYQPGRYLNTPSKRDPITGNIQHPYCGCTSGYYHYPNHEKCYQCIYPCIYCNSATQCTYKKDCQYKTSGMFYSGNRCHICPYPCATCESNSFCLTCTNPKNRYTPKLSFSRDEGRYRWYNIDCPCYYGYFDNDTECIKCEPPCVQCTDIETCTSHDCQSEISGQWFNSSTHTCDMCEFPCKTCEDSKLNCLSCDSDAENRNEAPDCQCKIGFYTLDNICIQCKLPCKTCTDEKTCIEYDCQSSFSGMYLFTPDRVGEWNDPACESMSELDQKLNECFIHIPYCKRCEYPCETCDSLDNCLQCGYTGINRIDTVCTCKPGYFSDDTLCIQNECTSPCSRCTSPAVCTHCIDGYYLSGISCQQCNENLNCRTCSDFSSCSSCLDSHYLEGSDCVPCAYPCVKCKSQTFCLQCGYDTDYRLSQPSCACLKEYYDSGAGCIKCIAPCEQCNSQSQTDCITCVKGYYISGTTCNFCPESCSDCIGPLDCGSCSDGYYRVDTKCLPCQYPCATCLDEQFCYTCGYEPEKRFKPPGCKCNYLDEFWDNGLEQCTTCDPPCRACDTETKVCTSCVDNHYFVASGETRERFVEAVDGVVTQEVTRPDGSVVTVNGNMVEYVHHGDCLPCMEGSSYCTQVDKTIKCEDGYYLKDYKCHACASPCLTCVNSAKFCLTCGYGEEDRYYPPICKCKEENSMGELISDHGDKCDVCTSPCLTCFGPGTDQCRSCEPTFYLSGNDCLSCDESCYHCSGPGNNQCILHNIIKCNDGYYPNQISYSGNPKRLTLTSGICSKCNYPCLKCSSSIYCYECGYDIENRLPAPDCRCKDEFYDDYINKNCVSCNEPCKTCNSDLNTDCTSCIDGFFIQSNGECIDCATGCTKCMDNLNNCQECTDEYYLSGNTCIICQYPCETCYSAIGCYSCVEDVSKRSAIPNCQCKVEYSDVNQKCIDCVDPCDTCDSEDGTSCTSCIWKYYLAPGNICTLCPSECARCTSPSVCTKCEDGYYLQGNDCLQCQHPCVNCLTSTYCLTCINPEVRSPPPLCGCQYEYITLGDQCILCTPPCKSCNGQTDQHCLSCETGYFLVDTHCELCVSPCDTCTGSQDNCLTCVDEYFIDTSSGSIKCEQCEYPCINCFSPTECLSCGFSPEKRVQPPTCECSPGYIEVGQDCMQCSPPCVTCGSTSSTDCISCQVGDFLDGTECKTCKEGCFNCIGVFDFCPQCKTGYYQEGTTCEPCDFPCQECYGPGFLCTVCDGNPAERHPPPSCQCKFGESSDDVTLRQCITCTHPCQTCSSGSTSNCTGCVDEYYLVDTTCTPCKEGCRRCEDSPEICSQCMPGYFKEGDTCSKCDSPCAECYRTKDFCLVCGYGASQRIHPPSCKCKDDVNVDGKELGDDGTQCVYCVDPCKSCKGVGTNDCLSCIDGYYLDEDVGSCNNCLAGCIGCTIDFQDECTSCFGGYFLRGVQCLPCEYPCQTCLESDYCFTCGFDPDNRRFDPPGCRCDNQYYDNGIKCIQCISPCKTCMSESMTDCLSCVDPFYLEGTQCRPCGTGCLKCVDQQDKCQECDSGYYYDGEQSCQQCVYPCATCLNEVYCYTCGYDEINRIAPPQCSCVLGRSDNGSSCIVCIPPCKTCNSNNSDDCITCIDNHYFDGVKECIQCDPGCKKCTAYSTCQDCNDGWFFDGESCIQCQSPCQFCKDLTRCITCIDSVNRFVPPTCKCDDGYYEATDGTGCILCQTPGLVCDSQTDYRICAEGYFWKSDGEFDGEGDPITYHNPSLNGTCIQCIAPCSKCFNETFCYECTSAVNIADPPTCICALGYYYDLDTLKCEQCLDPGLYCDSKTEFTKCQPRYYIEGTECLTCQYPCLECINLFTCITCVDNTARRDAPECTCEPEYYDVTSDGTELNICTQCPSPSVICENEIKFLKCQDFYYLDGDNFTCLPCEYPCETCESPIYCLTCGYSPEHREDSQSCACKYGEYYQADPADTICTECSTPCDKCIGLNKCLTCEMGYTLNGQTCEPCEPGCSHCVGSICLSCGLPIEGPNTPSCDCLQETGNSGTYQECFDKNRTLCPLLPCQIPCENCSSKTQCTTCISPEFTYPANDVTNSCKCLPGYEMNGLNKCTIICPDQQFGIRDQCHPCQPPCYNCDGEAERCISCITNYKYYGNFQCIMQCQPPCDTCITPTQCITCTGLFRDGENNCECQQGYYEDDNNLCQKCVHPCKTCGEIDECDSCVDGEFRDGIDQNCQCMTGFSEFEKTCIKVCEPGTFNLYDSCIQCDIQCKTCQGSGSNCLECKKGYYPDQETCIRCPNNCLECDGDGECTSCDITQHGRQNILPDCPCEPGTFERNTLDCGICLFPCATCQNYRTECVDCVSDGQVRKPAPDCTCQDGYYDKDGLCLKCNDLCSQCQHHADLCIECQSGYVGRESTTPDCLCGDGYFDNNGELDCGVCEYPCETCEDSSTNCLVCVFPTEQRYSSPNCNCLPKYFRNLGSDHCEECVSYCAQCKTQDTYCTKCEGANRSTPTCACREGYFSNGNLSSDCTKCENQCRTCQTSKEQCVDCAYGPNREDPPNCSCKVGFYLQDKVNICIKCRHPCLECSDEETCTQCVVDTDSNRHDISQNCQCKRGFYSSGEKCEICDKSCITCKYKAYQCIEFNEEFKQEGCDIECQICNGVTQSCIKCQKGAYRDEDASLGCPCMEGYYPQNNSPDCQPCNTKCKSCVNGDLCTLCRNPQLRAPFCKQYIGNVVKLPDNKQGNGSQGGNQFFEYCSPVCKACDSMTHTCLTCQLGEYRHNNPPYCSCKDGYHDEENTSKDCLPCPKHCETCFSSNRCYTCKRGSNRVLSSKEYVCECKPGFKEVDNQTKCIKCYEYLEDCYVMCPYNTIQNEQLGVCEEKTFVFVNNSGAIVLAGFCIIFIFFVLYAGLYNTLKRKYNITTHNPYNDVNIEIDSDEELDNLFQKQNQTKKYYI